MNTSSHNDIASHLEPVIITYNRSAQLSRTLKAFAESALKNVTFHVLDNASTDDTHQVVVEMQQKLPNLVYHRNEYNIGGNSNILRAVELGNASYHWVIGDDDEWQITADKLDELVRILAQGKADIVRLGWLVSDDSRHQLELVSDLIIKEKMFFASVSMISATIIRRSLVTSTLPKAYQNVNDSYPQLVAPICAVEQGQVFVYTMSQDFMTHTPSQVPGYFCGDLEWPSGWYRTSRFFANEQFKKAFVSEVGCYMTRDKPGMFSESIILTKILLYYKSFGLNQWPYLLSMLAYGSGRRWMVAYLIIVNALSPTILLNKLRKLYFKIKKLPPKTIQVDRSRL
tara:strand:- start:2479 stop:3504 length:1026 start_codon:yes stop_codon:yes gene_type:complete